VLQYLPFGLLIAGIVLVELLLVVGSWTIGGGAPHAAAVPIPGNVPNTEALGLVLYTNYVYYFEAAGMILLVAMIGAIVLTLEHRVRVKRQNVYEQNNRMPADAIEIVKVKVGQGLGSNR
jgi:NADH-quinone oxidoreductase subunit J